MSFHFIRKMRVIGFAAALLLGTTASAHTVWLEAAKDNPRQYQVLFNGHGGKVEPADPKKLKAFEARDAHGRRLDVKRTDGADGIKLRVDGDPAVITVHLDNGTHSRKAEGPSIEAPMNEVPGAIKATRALKYHKTIVSWQPSVTRAIGQPFEVVPVDATQPQAGKPFRVRVLIEGKPAAGVKLGTGEDGGENAPVTDANGVAAFVPAAGFNKMWAGKREAVTGNPAYTELSTEYLLGFTAR
jgi:nickel transport protein